MLKLTDLALRSDFRVGPLSISPSRRRVSGPAGEIQLEPLIMQLFLLLFDSGGRVVTRNELFDQLWGGVMVGEDSLNRAVAKTRRIAAQTAPGAFEIETIPRTGYRMTGEILPLLDEQPAERDQSDSRHVSRRSVVVGGSAVALAVAAGGGGWWAIRYSQTRRHYDALMDGAERALQESSPTSAVTAVRFLRPAVDLRPGDSTALGRLAFAQALVSEYGDPQAAGTAVLGAEKAARAALSLNPQQPDARLALVLIQRSFLDIAETEQRLRAILATDPNHQATMKKLWDLLQSTGQSRAAFAMNERAISLDPLAPANNYPRAQLLWILGRNAEADRVIDRAMGLWPSHAFVRFARFTIYAFTGRPRAALAMLDNDALRPQTFSPAGIAAWRISLAALDQPSGSNVARALAANRELVRQTPALASQAVLVLSALGEVGGAFDIADDLLVYRRASANRPTAGSPRRSVDSTGWRFTPWLFTPPASAMWTDPRFTSLCDGIGLTDYWRKRGVTPDYLASA